MLSGGVTRAKRIEAEKRDRSSFYIPFTEVAGLCWLTLGLSCSQRKLAPLSNIHSLITVTLTSAPAFIICYAITLDFFISQLRRFSLVSWSLPRGRDAAGIQAYLPEEGNLSEGGLARLTGSGFKKSWVVLFYFFCWIREYSRVVYDTG